MEVTQKIFRREDNKLKKSKTSLIGSILLVISALLPCLDVLLKWIFPSIITMRDSTDVLITVNIWLATLYLAPTVILIAVSFKPNPNLYILPITMYFYSGMVYFAPTWGYTVNFLKFNSIITAIYSILAALAVLLITRYVKRLALNEKSNEDFYDDVREEFQKLQEENDELKSKIVLLEKKDI